MIRNVIPFIINSDGSYRPVYKPTVKSRSKHNNVIQVIAPFDTSVNIAVSYTTRQDIKKVYTEYLALSPLKGKDVLESDLEGFNEMADWNVWEMTVSAVPLNMLIANRSTKASINFNIVDIVSTEYLTNTINFGINGQDLPEVPQEDTLYVNQRPNFYSMRLSERLYAGQSFKKSSNGYVSTNITNLIANTELYDIVVEPSVLGEMPSSVPPSGVDFNTFMDYAYSLKNFKEFESEEEFPVFGEKEILYLAKKKFVEEGGETIPYNALYKWDSEENLYVLISAGGTGTGGGGGDAVTMSLLPSPIDAPLNFSFALGETLILRVNYSHSEFTPGTLRIFRGTTQVGTIGIQVGVTEINVTDYIRKGLNSITFRVTDGERTRSLSFGVTGVSVILTSTFNDEISYGSTVNLPFRIESEAQKKLYLTVDGFTETINVTQINNIKTLTGLTHGVKEVSMQAAAIIGSEEILSNVLRFNIIVVTQSTPALISSKFNILEASRGSNLVVDFIVFNPLQEFNQVTLKVNGDIKGQLSVDRKRQLWNVRNLSEGVNTLRIESSGVFKEFEILITPLSVDFSNVQDSFLTLFLTSGGITNSSIGKEKWENSYGLPISADLIGFNFASNGWINDSLVLNGNANITIPYKPFQNVVSNVGKTIEIEFETTDGLSDEFISCYHNNRGFIIYKDRAILRSSNTRTEVFFKENEKIKISFVINKTEGTTLTYINGVMSGIDRMNALTNFQQSTPQNIKINEKFVDGKVYNVRVYERSLSHQEILQNYLFDITSIEEKMQEYVFSDVLNQSGMPDLEKTKAKIPVMVIRTFVADEDGNRLPQTDSFRPFVSVTYEHPTDPSKNFDYPNVRLRTQGTSTLQYPVKNYRLYQGDLDTNPVVLNNEMHPAIRINLKADYMESSMSTDPGLALLFDKMYDKPIPPKELDGVSRTTIWSEGACALFHDDGTSIRFEGIYNVNGDKGDNKQWGFYPELPFPEEDMRRFEILFNASNHAVAFVKNSELTDGEFLKQIAEGFEIRYPDVYDDALEAIEANDFVTLESMYGKLREFIEFLSETDLTTIEGRQAFRTEFEQRAELEYFTKYLLAIFIFGLVDNFGKDLLLNTWGNEGGLYPKFFVVLYDMDSGIGVDNQGFMTDSSGNLLFDYNIEMEDEGVFAQASSKLWDAIVAAYPDELKTTYAQLRGSVFTFENIWEHLYTKQIATISKALYNANAIAKYIEIPGSSEWLWMLNGDRINQMRRWITNRLAYLDSKYEYNTDQSSIKMRLDILDTQGINFQVKTSIHQWVTAQLGNTTAGFMKTRVQLGQIATLNHSYANGTELPFVEFELFGGKYITELVNVKDLPIRTIQIGQAEQLKLIDLSKEASDTQIQSISFGNNNELLEVNLRNNSGISGNLDLSGAIKLRKLDLRGTSITSVELPEGGVLEEVYLPSTLTSLQIKNQSYINVIEIEDGAEIEILVIENSKVDYRDLFIYLVDDARIRITGLEMSAYGSDILTDLKDSLVGKRGIDTFDVLIDNPYIQGIIKVLDSVNIDPSIVSWFDINQTELFIEVNIVLPELTFVDEGEYITLSSYSGNANGMLAIPSEINASLSIENNIIFGVDGWKPVKKIDNSALANKDFNQITLPSSLEEIGGSAFQGSDEFSEILIPGTVLTVGADAFANNKDNLLILVEHDERPNGWNVNWNSGNNEVIWGLRSTPTLFTFNTNGGDVIQSVSAKYLLTQPVANKFGYNNTGWFVNGQPITFPYVPSKSDPLAIELSIAEWQPWVYDVRYKLPDGSTYATQSVTYGNTLGSYFTSIDKGGEDEPTIEGFILKGWYTSESSGTRLTSSFLVNQDANEQGLVVNFYAQVFSVQGIVMTYDAGSDVYDVTSFNLTDTSMPDASINLLIPSQWNGSNGLKNVRHVTLASSNTTHRQKLLSVTIEENSLTGRIYKNNTSYSSSQGSSFEFLREVIIPEGFSTINNYAFENCSSLTSITIPEGVTSIEALTFNGCTSLTAITIPSTVTSIKTNAFADCTSLESVVLERDNLTASYFGEFQTGSNITFYITQTQNSIKLTNDGKGVMNISETILYTYPSASGEFDFSEKLPSTVTSIENNAFKNCSSLTSITISEGVTNIGRYVFDSCSNLTSVTIPSTITIIGSNAFQGCRSLTSIIIPSGVASIENNVFNGCTSLTSVTIPSTVTSIGLGAFYRCTSLTSATIPSTVTSIGINAFYNCGSLISVILLRTTPPTLGSGAFSNNASGRTFYIPTGTYSAYSTATNWSSFASAMEEV